MSQGAMLGGIKFGGLFRVSWPSLLKRWVEMWCHISNIFQHPFGSGVFPCCVRNVGGKRAQETLALHFTLYRKFWFYIPFLSGSAKYTTLNAGSPGHKRAFSGAVLGAVSGMFGAGSGPGGGNVALFTFSLCFTMFGGEGFRETISSGPVHIIVVAVSGIVKPNIFHTSRLLHPKSNVTHIQDKSPTCRIPENKKVGYLPFYSQGLEPLCETMGPKIRVFWKIGRIPECRKCSNITAKWYCQRLLVFPKENLDRVLKIK